MREVTWVKFPTIPAQRMTGKKLLGRQDKFEITTRPPLFMQHFEKEQLQNDEHAVAFPEYFFWNNHGLVKNHARRSEAADKKAFGYVYCTCIISVTCCIHPPYTPEVCIITGSSSK